MSSQATPRIGYSEALASGQFRALFASQLVSVSGTSIAAVALTILVYQRTASPLLASLTFALGFLPYLLGGGLLSGVIDRVRPRRLVVSCDLVSAVLAATMAWPAIPVTILLTLLLAIGTLASVSSGARVALARSTVSEGAYVPARSLMRIAAQVAQLGGNAAGGALLVVLTPSGALLVNAGSFAFSAAAVRFAVADHANAGQPSQARLLRDSLRGARTILAHAELRRLLLVGWLAPMFAVAPEALAAPYVAAHHGSSTLVGWWLVALPVGLIAGDRARGSRRVRALPRLRVRPAHPDRPVAAGRLRRLRPLHARPGRPRARRGAAPALRPHNDPELGRADDPARRRIHARRCHRARHRPRHRHRDRRQSRPHSDDRAAAIRPTTASRAYRPLDTAPQAAACQRAHRVGVPEMPKLRQGHVQSRAELSRFCL